jgi:hypothetical protein
MRGGPPFFNFSLHQGCKPVIWSPSALGPEGCYSEPKTFMPRIASFQIALSMSRRRKFVRFAARARRNNASGRSNLAIDAFIDKLANRAVRLGRIRSQKYSKILESRQRESPHAGEGKIARARPFRPYMQPVEPAKSCWVSSRLVHHSLKNLGADGVFVAQFDRRNQREWDATT